MAAHSAAVAVGVLIGWLPSGASVRAQERLTIVAPAAPGGGWDQTARAMQQALEAEGIVASVQVENVPGAAGTIGLAQFVSNRRGDPRALLVTGLVMVGAIEMNGSPVSLAGVTPLARLTGEYEVVVVPATSPLSSLGDLVEALQSTPEAVSWGGGSAGGTDHLLAGLVAAAVDVDPRRITYVAFSGGGEALAAMLGGQVTVGVSGYAELEPHIVSGQLRALAISSPARVTGVEVPTFKEQGLDIELANWRAVVAPPELDDDDRRSLADAMARMRSSPTWQTTLERYRWNDLYLDAEAFARFLTTERTRVSAIVARLQTDTTTSTSPGSMVFPVAIGLGTLVVAAMLLFERRRAPAPVVAGASSTINRKAVTFLAAGLGLNLILLEPAGFVPASSVLFWMTARGFGSRRPIRDAVVAVMLSTLLYVTFSRGLGVALPAGALGCLFTSSTCWPTLR